MNIREKVWCAVGKQEQCYCEKFCVRDGKVCEHLLIGFEKVVESKSEVEPK